jgi:hypothetical protein
MNLLASITHTDLLIAFGVVSFLLFLFVLRIKGHLSFTVSTVILDHWGDCIGLFLILLGVTIIMVSPLYTSQTATVQVMTTGSGLITAGFVALKLKTVPSSDNGGSSTTTDTHTTEVTPSVPLTASSGSTVVVGSIIPTPIEEEKKE